MLSRRSFLQVYGVGFPLLDKMFRTARPSKASEIRLPAHVASKRDYWNDWSDYLAAEVRRARPQREADLTAIRTQAELRSRQASVRSRVWRLIGGPIEKTPLNATTVGSLQQDTYKIEKIIFQSQPGVFVTAHLYIPTAAQSPFCGIVSPPGHYWEGKSARDYQHLYQNLARKGYMVLAFDLFGEGERQQYLDPRTGQSRYSYPTNEHDQAGRPLVLLGMSFAQYCVWDSVRAVDYLASRPEVNPERIGCVGHSGGATLTMYLCALEPRIQVAVAVEGHFRNFAARRYDAPGSIDDAEQNLAGSLEEHVDRADLLRAFAPKPLLMCYTAQDVITSPFYLTAVQEVFQEVSSAYGTLNASKQVRLFRGFLPHQYDFFNRRETYAWFNRWLAKRDLGVSEAELDEIPPEKLRCTRTGQVLTSLGGLSVFKLSAQRMRALAPASASTASSQEADQARVGIAGKLRGLLSLPPARNALATRTLSSDSRSNLTIEEFEFRSEPHIRIPGWFVKPGAAATPLPTVLYLTEGDKDAAADSASQIRGLVKKGFALCAVDLRGFGITSPRFPAYGALRYQDGRDHLREDFAWASLILGKPPLGQRTWDLMRCLDYLESRRDVDRDRIYVFGVRGGALAALTAYVLDHRPRSILCDGMISNLASIVESENYSWGLAWFVSGILREFDLPDLIAACVPRPLWLLNAAGPTDEVLAEPDVTLHLQPAVESYARLNASDHLRTFVEAREKRMEVVTSWLQSA